MTRHAVMKHHKQIRGKQHIYCWDALSASSVSVSEYATVLLLLSGCYLHWATENDDELIDAVLQLAILLQVHVLHFSQRDCNMCHLSVMTWSNAVRVNCSMSDTVQLVVGLPRVLVVPVFALLHCWLGSDLCFSQLVTSCCVWAYACHMGFHACPAMPSSLSSSCS